MLKEYMFQGMPIVIETPRGSDRHWYDPFNNEHGSTEMKNDYGYVKGTLGVDGDEVDVYVGPNPHSRKVFIITQSKAPEFVEVDEQKCMIGFDNPESAKDTYLKHYNDPRFFMSMKELDVEEFREKVRSFKGRLIKNMDDIDKSLKAVIAEFVRKQSEQSNYSAGIATEQPAIGSNVPIVHGQPVPIPVRKLNFFPPMFSIQPLKVPE